MKFRPFPIRLPVRLTGAWAMLGLMLCGCGTAGDFEADRKVSMIVTAYCSCATCCGWERSVLGVPVFKDGPNKGKRKAVGICADGSRVRPGIVAADTDHYPFGTRLEIPGYGVVVVRDRGGKIKGAHRLDLYFPRHGDALKWGKQELSVTVFK